MRAAIPGLAGITRKAEKGNNMLDWLKPILGDNYTEEIDKAVHAELGKHFVTKADFNAANESKKNAQDAVTERDRQIEEPKKVDATQLQAEITRLQTENTAIVFDTALSSALLGAKAKNVKAVSALLNRDGLKFEDGKITGLDEQLKKVKEENAYLFESEQAGGFGFRGKAPADEKTGNSKMNALIRGENEGE